MKTIVCNFNLFDAKQKALILNEKNDIINTVVIDTLDFGKNLAALCEAENVYDICLDGPTDYVLNKIIPEVDEYSSDKFSNHKINIRVKGV